MIITLTGPTCSGKTTVEAELHKLGFGHAISHTTRKPRTGEVNGVNYIFVSDQEFDALEESMQFVESVSFSGSRYGMSQASLVKANAQNKNVVMVLEPNGTMQIVDFCKQNGIEVLPVWVECNAQVQANRWLARLQHDLKTKVDVLHVYAERLAMMLTEEITWRERDDVDYDFYLDSSRQTADQLARRIAALIE